MEIHCGLMEQYHGNIIEYLSWGCMNHRNLPWGFFMGDTPISVLVRWEIPVSYMEVNHSLGNSSKSTVDCLLLSG